MACTNCHDTGSVCSRDGDWVRHCHCALGHRAQFQEAVMGFRKAAYEFGLVNHEEDHATMLVWQRRLFDLYDRASAPSDSPSSGE